MDATTTGSAPDTRSRESEARRVTGSRAVPVEVLVEEARRAADVLERHALPTPASDLGPAHEGLASADPCLTPALADELRALCTRVEGSTRRVLTPFSPGIVAEGRQCLVEALAIMRARARHCPSLGKALETHRRVHVRPRAATTVRDALTSLVAILTTHPDAGPGLLPVITARRDALAGEIAARATLRDQHEKFPSARMLAMGRIATLLAKIRAAARHVLAQHPSLRLEVTSEYQRRVKRERRARGAR